MKKTLVIFAGILVGIFVVLTLINAKDEYAVEQIIWKTNQQFSVAAKTPETVPDKVFKDIAAQYSAVIENFPNSKLLPRVYILLGQVYVTQKQYDVAREKFSEVLKKYPGNSILCAEALSETGKTYETQNNWSGALENYQQIIRDYPLTDIGLSASLYIATWYRTHNEISRAQEAYRNAIAYYKSLATQHANAEAGVKALRLLTNCYLDLRRWAEAVDVMGRILLEYPYSPAAPMTIKAINNISITQLKDSGKAISIYSDFIAKNPEHPFNKTLKDMIIAFKKLEEKNVEVTTK